MKNLFLAICLSMMFAASAQASELLGKISTDPNSPINNSVNSPAEIPAEPIVPAPPVVAAKTKKAGNSSGWIYQNKTASAGKTVAKSEKQIPAIKQPGKGDDKTGIKVAGISHFADGSLLRDGKHKIYLVEKKTKKQIANLAELKKYAGKKIYSATDEELSQYQIWKHPNGDLIREIKDVKIFVIKQGKKQHVLNLEELRENYSGREIFNVSREGIDSY
jgi:hypothetical protein